MDDDGIVDFTAYRRGESNRVPCPQCSRPIPAESTRCPECRVHFQGFAYEFAENKTREFGFEKSWVRLASWVVLTIIGLIVAAVIVGAILN